MIEDTNLQIDEPNRWRLETPGASGWKKSARPGDPNRYLMISADCHVQEPSGLWASRMDKKYHDRLPRIIVDEKGNKVMIAEGMRKSRLLDVNLQGEEELRNKSGYTPEQRILDHRRDGIDAEIMFPNKGLSMWATTDAEFGAAQCRVWNDWAW
ncbi:MAG: amidohydrolase family protein, partial [Candidatus Binataceae bacterium]